MLLLQHAGIHIARYFWVFIVLIFGCCIGGYLRHQKVSFDEVASIKYLAPRRVTSGSTAKGGLERGTSGASASPKVTDLEAGTCAGGS